MRSNSAARSAAKSAGFMSAGASSREARARRSKIWPQRDTMRPLLPASAARTSEAFWWPSDPAGRPPSLSATMPIWPIERRAPAGISNFGLRPSRSVSSSDDILASTSSGGNLIEDAPDATGALLTGAPAPPPSEGRPWTTGAATVVPCPAARGAGAAAGAGVGVGARGVAALGTGRSKPGGSSDSGPFCASAQAEVRASEAPTSSKARLIRATPELQQARKWCATSARRHRSRHRPAATALLPQGPRATSSCA